MVSSFSKKEETRYFVNKMLKNGCAPQKWRTFFSLDSKYPERSQFEIESVNCDLFLFE